MAVNRSEQTLENRLTSRVKYLEREMNALKTRQLLGGDNFVLENSSISALGPLVVPSFTHQNFLSTLTSLVNKPMFPMFEFSLFLDAVDSDHLWPHGNALTANQKQNIRLWIRRDWWNTSLDNTIIGDSIQVFNGTGADIDIYVRSQYVLPKVSLA